MLKVTKLINSTSKITFTNQTLNRFYTTKVTANDFEKLVLKSDKPVILDVYADWCGPCRMIAGPLAKAVDSKNGSMILYKLDFDESPSIAEKYNVMSIPHVFAFHKGEIIDQFIGAIPEPRINQFLDNVQKKVNTK
ncbi:thioredoxin domain-containing protein [Tieghemostelium lacteum]|uniref:Thioredoxin domain-containing protein n=1 Tax=Tieghemostelium lacteum TaxID=361077 RepID=A0A151ZJG4_TIELA|nr:thioredoxin domain-containing protein [Tieghemostelium lacteum]|eukprot:KYQ94141.1 thioredoxin domain-containing protein [Tieghemostelium lacteum]